MTEIEQAENIAFAELEHKTRESHNCNRAIIQFSGQRPDIDEIRTDTDLVPTARSKRPLITLR